MARNDEKEQSSAPKKYGLWSLILGIVSWVGVITVVVPAVCTVLSFIMGYKAIKNNSGYKKCAIAGMILSALVLVFIVWACFQPSSDSNKSNETQVEVSDEYVSVESEDSATEQKSLVDEQNEEPLEQEIEATEDKVEVIEEKVEAAENEDNEEDIQEASDYASDEDQNQGSNEDSKAYEINIVLNYTKTSGSYNDPAIIYIDGTEIGKITAGNEQMYKVILDKGKHKIWLKSDTKIRHNNSKKLKFKVSSETSTIHFEVKDGSLAGLSIKVQDD
jgi:hypothetical protein